jgi:YcxB-like protein
MQPPPLPDTLTVSYQVPRDVLIRVWFRRYLRRPNLFCLLGSEILLAIICFILGGGGQIAAIVLLAFAAVTPIGMYRGIVRKVDSDPMLTDAKTVEVGPSRIVITGPNWKSEVPWTRFQGFSEDDTYFYLHLSNVIASIIPKSAFTPDQQQIFRQYAQTRNT